MQPDATDQAVGTAAEEREGQHGQRRQHAGRADAHAEVGTEGVEHHAHAAHRHPEVQRQEDDRGADKDPS